MSSSDLFYIWEIKLELYLYLFKSFSSLFCILYTNSLVPIPLPVTVPVPVVGKIPNTEPDWLTENGLWTYDVNKLVEILGTFILAWLEGVELTSEVKEKMRETVVPYTKETHNNNTLSIFNSLISIREDSIKKAIEKVKAENNEE